MRVLVLGQGAREHAIVWKLNQDHPDLDLYVCPGNAGMEPLATRLSAGAVPAPAWALADLAAKYEIDLTIVGPEQLLADGVVDEFTARGLPIFGPTKAGARLESSKIYAKDIMQRAGIPTAAWRAFTDPDAARAYAETLNWRCAIKFDGLAAGKGTEVCTSETDVDEALQTLLERHLYGAGPVLIEDLLEGEEVSVFAISDGRTVVPFGAAQDHKRRDEGDRGPNTGGMGAYSPVSHMQVAEEFAGSIFQPLVTTLAARGTPYVGVLYAGAIMTSQGPAILELNCRLGDPEAEVLLPRLTSDLLELLTAAIETRLHAVAAPVFADRDALCVVMAAEGYPDKSPDGDPIDGLEQASALPNVLVFHAGTEHGDGRTVTHGGRVVAVTALGVGLPIARTRAYNAVDLLHFNGVHYRHDIGAKAVRRQAIPEWQRPPRWEANAIDASRVIGEVLQQLTSIDASTTPLDVPRMIKRLAEAKTDLQTNIAPSRALHPALLLPVAVGPDGRERTLHERAREFTDRMQGDDIDRGMHALFGDSATDADIAADADLPDLQDRGANGAPS